MNEFKLNQMLIEIKADLEYAHKIYDEMMEAYRAQKACELKQAA